MPHDMNGNELRVGTTVLIPCQVKAIHLTEQYCNVDLETNIPMYPSDNRTTLTLNSKQTIKKETADEVRLMRELRVIIDYVCKNGVAVGFPSAVTDIAQQLRAQLDKALFPQEEDRERQVDYDLSKRW